MVSVKSYRKLLNDLLSATEKLERYRHHVVSISTYLNLRCIPKGFHLKAHNNIRECDLGPALKKCSKKNMIKTVKHYQGKLKFLAKDVSCAIEEISEHHPNELNDALQKSKDREKNLRTLFATRRRDKFSRDSLDYRKSEKYSRTCLQYLIDGKCPPTASDLLREEILSSSEIPPFDPINLDGLERELPSGLSELCQRGPSFIPIPDSYDWLQLQKDFDRFRNRVRSTVFFSSKPQTERVCNDVTGIQPPRAPSSWKAPKAAIPEVETFLSSVERDLFSSTKRRVVTDNLKPEERSALKQWRSEHLFNPDSDLVIRQQDKGNRFVVVDKETDIKKAEEQIQRSSFQTVTSDPTPDHIRRVKDWAETWHARNKISEEWKNFIINNEAVPGKNTPLYKTHKNNTPVRLLTTGCNTAIENLSKFLEQVSAPLTNTMRSRIKDRGHLLEIIDDINSRGVPPGTILVSLDIVNMFPNIDNERGLDTLRKVFDTRSTRKPPTECLVEALRLCLYCNNSMFNNNHLLQTNGTATGAPNSCSYSDLALKPIDDAIFREAELHYPELIFYGRYRDDCFILWNGSRERLEQFLAFVNTLDEFLKFTMEIGGDSLAYLDLMISIMNGQLFTTVYSKPTDSHLYLQSDSCHPKQSIKGIQKGVALRLRRICTTVEEYDTKSKEYTAYLVARGHDPLSVLSTFESTRNLSVAEARRKVLRDSHTRVVFPTTFNPRGPNVRAIVKKHSHLLSKSLAAKKVFPNGVMVAYKREQNLKELLTRADPYSIKSAITDLTPRGYKRCSQKCDSCDNFVMETDSIVSFATGKRYRVRGDFNCNTTHLIYCAICTKCCQQGVGSTIVWKPRLACYKSHIKHHHETCGIVKHFIHQCPNDENPGDHLVFVILDSLNNISGLSEDQIEELLLQKEKFWIGTLCTMHKGMNLTHDWNRTKRSDK